MNLKELMKNFTPKTELSSEILLELTDNGFRKVTSGDTINLEVQYIWEGIVGEKEVCITVYLKMSKIKLIVSPREKSEYTSPVLTESNYVNSSDFKDKLKKILEDLNK